MKLRILTLGLLFACHGWAGVEEDWEKITALDAGPGASWRSREEARTGTLAFLDTQEKALRSFITGHPTDPRAVDARLRLVHLLATRADLQASPKPRTEAGQILDELARTVPAERKADVEFARISLSMRKSSPTDSATRTGLSNKARGFEKAFPDDRRVAPLLAEVATLFDREPARKKELLESALARTSDEDLRHRIEDDLKRVALLNQTVPLKFTALRGEEIETEKLRGRVVLLYFFADWSPPSISLLNAVRDLAAGFPAGQVKAIGISLDESQGALLATLKAHKIAWPIYFDGRGWQSPFVRSLGINALPTLWILDRQGRLRALNAKDEAATLIAQLLREH